MSYLLPISINIANSLGEQGATFVMLALELIGMFTFLAGAVNVFSSPHRLRYCAVVIIGLIIMGSGFSLALGLDEIHARATAERVAIEAVAVQEYQVYKELDVQRAWWVNLSPFLLKVECQRISQLTGQDAQELYDLLAKDCAIVVLLPQTPVPQTP